MDKNPAGYYKYGLAMDCETSGMAYMADDPSVNPETGEIYQAVSVGLIVVDTVTLKTVKELYVEIKMEPGYAFDEKAYRVHGLSEQYLEENGMTSEEAATEIGSLILDYWGPTKPVSLIGQNVASFDVWFLKRLLRKHGLPIKFAHRHIDTSTIGLAFFGVYNSDDLFDVIGVEQRDPNAHNALDDARASLEAVRVVRRLAKTIFGD